MKQVVLLFIFFIQVKIKIEYHFETLNKLINIFESKLYYWLCNRKQPCPTSLVVKFNLLFQKKKIIIIVAAPDLHSSRDREKERENK